MIKVKNTRFRQKYHVMPPKGWMNDPNGLCFFNGYYHVFFQYHPHSADWGPMHWGHVRSLDLVHWENCPIALVPGNKEDKDGCFSGSAVIKDDKLYLIYTGHHYVPGSGKKSFWQTQNIAVSTDGLHFEKYENNPIITTPPADNSEDFRDPKVWYEKGLWQLILGSQGSEHQGRVLLYRSPDLFNWKYVGVLAQADLKNNEGFMWECPDLFQLGHQQILLVSPQGIKATSEKFKNLYQTGYFIINSENKSNFYELDSGHDFYATQTQLLEDGRRIMFAWMDMWESKMQEQLDGWAGTLTVPRELSVKNGKLYSYPISELKSLRQKLLFSQQSDGMEINFSSASHALEINAVIEWPKSATNIIFSLKDKCEQDIIKLLFDFQSRIAYLQRVGSDGKRQCSFSQNHELKLKIYVDSSSLEIFINAGECSFSERFYVEDQLNFQFKANRQIKQHIDVYQLD
ncbi:glycoside hydrolase family 32 protein [Liquorilactobacillus satsumensis]|uniref:glycoside hydrolase family 32 protein n=1 Tax=Liquorilactobacillus TaxID=2767888 RepID=UPI001E5EC4AD|nr:glycoside hydrolase family 32 protein [Liquorilactobacillus satsumensis]MCC7667239.1 sucrose-6-phosphate hydrolase [Liquorilactobacillus satsumensis]MCP9328076.1 glycoside hydrolase family 32 protein [Liquorilactobacillus satsumensis]